MTIPLWLRPFLPHIIAVAAILGVVWWLDHQGYERAKKDAERERLITALMMTRAARDSEGRMAGRIHDISRRFVDQIASIDATHTETQRIIEREVARDPSYSDPDLGISERMFEAINRTRASLACTAHPDGGIECALPPAAPADRPVEGRAGLKGQ